MTGDQRVNGHSHLQWLDAESRTYPVRQRFNLLAYSSMSGTGHTTLNDRMRSNQESDDIDARGSRNPRCICISPERHLQPNAFPSDPKRSPIVGFIPSKTLCPSIFLYRFFIATPVILSIVNRRLLTNSRSSLFLLSD